MKDPKGLSYTAEVRAGVDLRCGFSLLLLAVVPHMSGCASRASRPSPPAAAKPDKKTERKAVSPKITNSALLVFTDLDPKRFEEMSRLRSVAEEAGFSLEIQRKDGSLKVPQNASAVYVIGFGAAATRAVRYACSTRSVRGLALVSGLMTSGLERSCRSAPPLSFALFAGDEDPFVPFGGGRTKDRAATVVKSAAATVRYWKRHNHCPADALAEFKETRISATAEDQSAITRRELAGCRGDTSVLDVTIHHGGSTWPGSRMTESGAGRATTHLDASRTLIEFFAR